MRLAINPGSKLVGDLTIPSDKSMTHRALIISAISTNFVTLHSWLPSLDCKATLQVLQAMGIEVKHLDTQTLAIQGVGLYGLQKPKQMLDVGNSGTAMRLLTGILAAQKFDSQITGDISLCKRPMLRIIDPLTLMGAKITAVNNNFAPLTIQGGRKLKSITYKLPVASAQLKSAILLADLYAEGKSKVIELVPTRNHTELMLQYFANNPRQNLSLKIPGDISSAAFFIVGACIAEGSDLLLKNIGINPTRTGILEILHLMGADINLSNIEIHNGELSADIHVKSAKLQAIDIPLELVPNAIDEFPILAIAAACANGTTIIRGAQELKYKESNRILAIASGLKILGIKAQIFEDGLAITGGKISGGTINSFGDHRIAMAFAMAALVAERLIIVQDTNNIATSFPDFAAIARQAGLLLEEISQEENLYV